MPRRTKPQAAATELPAEYPSEFQSSSSPDPDATGQAASEPAAPAKSEPAHQSPHLRRASEHSDTLAGVRLYWNFERERAEIKFDQKPGPDVVTFMHAQSKWDDKMKLWHMPIRTGHWQEDRLLARKTFHKACEMVRAEKGITEDGPALPD
jgi:hypothetical protein